MARNVAAVTRRSCVSSIFTSCESAFRSRAVRGSGVNSSLDHRRNSGGTITAANIMFAVAKITFIGAGSTVFARNLLGDILSYPELASSEIALFDIDAARLSTSELVARRVADALDAPAKITATTDRRSALDGADYAINMIQVGGYEPCTVTDFEIPKRFGLRQTIGDTLGIGGIMRALRTIPVLLSMTADMEELCPDVWFLNYTNPMAMNCRAITRASDIRTVGLC